MIAYKFLLEERVAPFSRVTWPEPGEWVETETVDLCRTGVHACRIRDLPYWLRPELWEIELGGEVVAGEVTVAAPRGRLVRRVEAWNHDVEVAFGEVCAAEARRRAEASPEYAVDAKQAAIATPVVTGFIAARLAELQEGPAGYDEERARQARWLAGALGLVEAPVEPDEGSAGS